MRFHQKHGFNFHDTFSLVVILTTIRIILTLELNYKWEVQQIYINNNIL